MEEQVWKFVALSSAIAGAAVLRPLTRRGWEAITKKDPPGGLFEGDFSWGEAAAWTLLSGAALGIGRLMGQRVAAEGWRVVKGEYPPGLRETM